MKRDKHTRVDRDFERKLKEIKCRRFKNSVDDDLKIRSNRELTAMMLNTPSFPNVERELSIMKRRIDLNRRRGNG